MGSFHLDDGLAANLRTCLEARQKEEEWARAHPKPPPDPRIPEQRHLDEAEDFITTDTQGEVYVSPEAVSAVAFLLSEYKRMKGKYEPENSRSQD